MVERDSSGLAELRRGAPVLVAHASPLHGPGGISCAAFQSVHASAVAAPVFLALAGRMIQLGLYYAWREWSAIRPAPASASATVLRGNAGRIDHAGRRDGQDRSTALDAGAACRAGIGGHEYLDAHPPR